MIKTALFHRLWLMAVIPLIILAIGAQTWSQSPAAGNKPTLRALAAAVPAPLNISNSSSNSSEPWVGVDGNGFAYAVWYEHLNGRTFYFSTNKSGAWSTPVMIEKLNYDTEESGWPVWAVSLSGAAHLTFFDAKVTTPTGLTYDVFDRAYENGAWGPTSNVSSNAVQNQSIYPGMAINPVDNYAYVVWSDHNGAQDFREIKYRYRRADGVWVPTPYPPVGSRDTILPVSYGDIPRIAVDGAGTAHMVWGFIHGRRIWYSKNRTPQNRDTWTTPIVIKADAGNEWSNPIVTCDNAGNAYVLWMNGPADWENGDPYNPNNPLNSAEIFVRKVNSDSTLGWEKNVSQSTAHSYYGSIAVNPVMGDLVVAWTEKNNIFANALIGGTWTGPGNLTNNAAGAESTMPRVAVDPSGRAHLVYAQAVSGGTADIMYMSIAGAIQVLAPNGGEVWNGGSSQTIKWTAPSSLPAVKIELSTDNGTSFQVVAASAPNTGSYAWTVPNTPSTHCLVKVSEALTGTPAAASSSVFSIVASSLTIAGKVTVGGAALPNVVMVGLPGNPVTNAQGQYTATVNYGWSGTVVPLKDRYDILPSSKSYSLVIADQIEQNYLATLSMLPYSGRFDSVGSWTGAGCGTDGWYLGDFNGDGKTDIFRYLPGVSGADVFLSNGSSFIYAGSWTGAGCGPDGWYLGDFNGDGKTDIFRYLPGVSGADVFLSSGSSFVYSGSWTGAGYGMGGWHPGDFNGDGKTDIFRYLPGVSGADVFLSSGSTFVRSGSWTGAGSGTDGWYLGDFNGDGKTDIFRYLPGVSGADVFLSNGTSFVRSGDWTGAGSGPDGWYLGDFNGDGKTDIFRYLPGVSGAEVFLSSGTAFVQDGNWTGAGYGAGGWYIGEFNGDARADIFRYLPGISGADVFLSHQTNYVSTPSMDSLMRGETVQSLSGLRESDESALLMPFIEAMKRGEHRSLLEIKKAYEEKAGRMVTKTFINRLLNKHGFWEKTSEDGKGIILK